MHEPSLTGLLPVLVAIGVALTTRRVVPALAAGMGVGSALLAEFAPWQTMKGVVDPYLLDAVADRGHMKVTLFSLLIAGMVNVLGANGATHSMVDLVTRRIARSRTSGQVATWVAGLVVFFDDYANCLVVGNSMRPVCDRLGISRAKLAYIVDCTAAPVATLALVSTWIAYEVGLIADGLAAAGSTANAYTFFLEGLPYRFYPWLTLVFALMIAVSGRDFGPMLEAERAAAPARTGADATGPLPSPLAAIVPVLVLVAVTIASLWRQGVATAAPGARLFEIIGGADGYDAMLEGAIAGLLTAVVLGWIAVRRNPFLAFDDAISGMGQIFDALVVLFCAWALGSMVRDLQAAEALVTAVGPHIWAPLLPTAVYALSCAIGFATGTSFGTMGVVLPLAIPLAFAVSGDAHAIPLATTSAVLAGAVWGDHCSPISDTTVLSATGAGCELDLHVRTQLPYAVVPGVLAMLLGTLPAGFGVNPWLCLVAGSAACAAVVWWKGKVSAGEQGPERSAAGP